MIRLKQKRYNKDRKLDYKRQFTVSKNGYTRRRKNLYSDYAHPQEPIPLIKMHGLWLREAGFAVNMRVQAKIMDECIVLTPIKPDE